MSDRIFYVAARLFSPLLFALLCSCGATIKVGTGAPERFRTLAVLPIVENKDISRERVEFVGSAFKRQLVAQGFEMVDDESIATRCGNSCELKSGLASRLGADAIAKIEILDTAATNLLAGHYNSINLKVSFWDNNGDLIYEISDRRSQRGGLLFDSGQVVEGIKATVNDFKGDPLQPLAEKLVDELVSKLPGPKGDVTSGPIVELHNVNVQVLDQSRVKICAQGTPKSIAQVSIGHRSTTLTENSAGTYCSAFFYDATSTPSATVSLKALSGSAISKQISFNPNPCVAKDAVARVDIKRIKLGCSKAQFFVFQAPSKEGPFALKSAAKSGDFLSRTEGSAGVIAVVAESSQGAPSLPVILQ